MSFTLIWSDYCVFILFGFIVGFILWMLRHASVRQQWIALCLRPLHMVAVILLCCYAIIGLLDSLHFEKPVSEGGGIVSVLDRLLAPMVTQTELTYSAPFAINGFTKETIINPDGSLTRGYPRLTHAGAHLKNPDLKNQDILNTLQYVILSSLIVWVAGTLILVGILSFYRHRSVESVIGSIITGRTRGPWRTILIMGGIVLFTVFFIASFMGHYHILGTDQVGEDVLYQSLKSIRTGLIIGTFTTLIMLPFAVLLGLLGGYFKGWIDDVVQFTYTLLSSIPAVLLIAAAILTLQIAMERHTDWFETINARSDGRLLALCAILGLTSWTSLCRYLRGEALRISQMDYVQAARAVGASNGSILARHLLPNVMHIVLMTIALDFSGLVLAEAVLTYVGVGVDPNTYSWGIMINSARMELARVPVVWWSLFAAFLFMFILVLAANIFADALREQFNPHRASETS